MKKQMSLFSSVVLFLFATSVIQAADRYISTKSHIQFFSTTPVEDIEANNYASVSTINPETGEVVFSIPMQSFEFEKALMQKHFNNEHFLETSMYPKSKLKGEITNLDEVDFSNDGTYEAQFQGEITIKDKTQSLEDNTTVEVKGNTVTATTEFYLTLADFGITFDEGEMVSEKIAKKVLVSVNAVYEKE